MKKCQYCAEEIKDDAIKCRYCQSDLSKMSQEAEKKQVPVEKKDQQNSAKKIEAKKIKTPEDIRKSLRIAGVLAMAAGAIMFVYFAYTLWDAFSLLFVYKKTLIAGILFPVYIALGKRVYIGTDKDILKYIKILFITSIVIATLSLVTKGFFALIIHGLIAVYFFMIKADVQEQEFINTLKPNKYNISKKDLITYGAIYFLVIAVVVLMMFIRADRYISGAPEGVDKKSVETDAKKDSTPKDDDTNEKLKEIAEEVNKSTPSMVDDITQFTSMEAIDHGVIYNYSITDKTVRATVETAEGVKDFKQDALIEEYCTDPNMRTLLVDMQVTTHSDYYDYKGDLIARVSVKPSDCD